MKKDGVYIWKIDIDGRVHEVRCVMQKTLYDVYADGELSIRAPRQLVRCDEDSEYDIRIGGKLCQFVVYDGVPDVAVDGILQGAEEEMRRRERTNRWLLFFGGIAVTLVSSFAVFLWYVFQAGEPVPGGYLSLACMLVFVAGGIAMVITSLKKKKEY